MEADRADGPLEWDGLERKHDFCGHAKAQSRDEAKLNFTYSPFIFAYYDINIARRRRGDMEDRSA